MNDQENKNIDTKNQKNSSELVTKESISAVCALFSALAFFILCTKGLVFGALGEAIHSFLIGVFGYCAYPVFLLFVWFSGTGLFGKKLVKQKGLTLGIIVSAVLLLLAIHTIQTTVVFGWELDGYIEKCFASGAEFPKAALCGWLGGLLVAAVASLISNVGAIVVFCLLTAFSVYLTVLFSKKSGQPKIQRVKKEKKVKIRKQDNDNQLSVAPTPVTGQAPVYGGVQVEQRPSVSLNADTGFSPFGENNSRIASENNLGHSYQDSRDYLFGSSTPRDNYKRNLIFDPTANVNNLPSVDPMQSVVTSGYVPSYADAYEESVNNEEQAAPLKIVSEQSPFYQTGNTNSEFQSEAATGYTQPMQSTPISYENPYTPQPIQPMEETVQPKTEFYSDFARDEERSQSYLSDEAPTPFDEREETSATDIGGREEFIQEPKQEETSDYKRHDYMNLFSTSNPNVFGRFEDVSEEETRSSLFDSVGSREEQFEEETEDSTRDRLNIFDEEPENDPYTLRSDYEEKPIESLGGRNENEAVEQERFVEESRSRWEENEPKKEVETPAFDRFNVPLEDSRRGFEEPIQSPISVPAPKPKKPHIPKPYKRISLDDLDCRDIEPTANAEEIERTKETIIATLEDFKVSGASIASVTFGPTVTRYNVTIPRNISPKKIVALDQSIAINLYSEGVSIYPNYEDGVVSIEVPNKERQFVQLGCMLSGDSYVNAKASSLMFAMGKDVANRKIYGDISKMIHLLVAGASGMGKSVFLGSLIISLIHRYSPEELRLILIDPKKTEFVLYNDLPHLMINEIITDVNKTVQSLNWAIEEMNRRYGLFEEMTKTNTAYVVNLDQYNAHVEKTERLPKIVIIIDELADLMLAAKKEMEEKIQNLTQKARAAGIHLIVATQRPSTDVITGVIKSNLPTRIAFGVATDVDSRVILDQTGAQKLLGKGDFLYTMQGIKTPVRVQSAFISPEESQRVVNYIKENNEAYYDEEVMEYINKKSASSGDSSSRFDSNNVEPVYIEALRYVIAIGSASISMIQRKCSTGYNKAGKIIEWMEENNYISAFDGARARKVLITQEDFERIYGNL